MDDDNYVNLRALLRLLASYLHTQDVYIGKPSLDRPIQATERVSENKVVSGPLSTVPRHTPYTRGAGGEGEDGSAAWGTPPQSHHLSPLQRPVHFWFATGGAGFCISRGLALKMSPWAR